MLRPEDELLILVPNRPVKVNRTALRILGAMVDEGLGIAEVLAREGDGPRRRARDPPLLRRPAVLARRVDSARATAAAPSSSEPFTADFCRYPVLAEVALTYRCNLTCAFCYAGCGVAGAARGLERGRAR